MRLASKRCICPEMAPNPTDSYLSTATGESENRLCLQTKAGRARAVVICKRVDQICICYDFKLDNFQVIISTSFLYSKILFVNDKKKLKLSLSPKNSKFSDCSLYENKSFSF